MRDDWGSTGVPEENHKLPLINKVHSLIAQDIALVQGLRLRGFSERQVALGFRQSVKLSRPPEVDVGALMDLGS
ncbi:MAG: hypothetical protein HY795_01520 [Desulfovibrio sp.]|jgi:hypothetical protein|nr:hypothetical protein [Desulfovibrio sp.]MBI4959049.1 hypothetical protein [Desulfovibrio sp.]